MQPPPLVQKVYTWDQYRAIAGFLIRQRESILTMIDMLQSGVADPIPEWRDETLAYWKHCEAFTRHLLHLTHYDVEKNKNYAGEIVSR